MLDNEIYNEDIEPEHDSEAYCSCSICHYKRYKSQRSRIHNLWSSATKYPGPEVPHTGPREFLAKIVNWQERRATMT